jgi:nucleotide-binding universal stress UspA family protein
MSLERIVVGVDMSELGAVALEQAAALGAAFNAELVLVHATGVTDTGIYVHDYTGRKGEPWKRYVTERVASAGERLEAAAHDLQARGVTASACLFDGFPDAAIASTASEQDADLVVVGTHGRSGTERWLLGSVAERVLRIVDRDLLVARAATTSGRPERVLVATDFSPVADAGMRLALDVTPPDAELTIVNCWHVPFGGDVPPLVRQQLVDEAEEAGRELLERHDFADREVAFRSLEGPPAASILGVLAGGEYDAAFIGSHGRRGLRRALLGSVAEQVVRHAPCSVYVAKRSE